MAEMKLPEGMHDVVIIGGGPAGLTAGLYAARAGFRTLLIEGASTVSQITATDMVENFPGMPEGVGGAELIDRFKQQAERFGVVTTRGDVSTIVEKVRDGVRGWEVVTDEGSQEALAVVVATGTTWRRLAVPGEEEFIGKGVSFCATCDGPFYRNREVVVVGGGDAAIQEALFLTHFAAKVTLVHRRDRLRGAKILQERAFANPKMQFVWNAVIEEIAGADFVEGVWVRDVRDNGEKRRIPADGVFVFIGLVPNTDFLKGIVALDKEGYITTTSGMETSSPGIFACGDCIAKSFRQVITACGDGATAAFSSQHYIEALKGNPYR
jgi:thioredoxin reductase (NADPH)